MSIFKVDLRKQVILNTQCYKININCGDKKIQIEKKNPV